MNITPGALLLILSFAITSGHAAVAGEPFKQVFQLQGITFTVEATNEGSLNQLTITPKGLTEVNEPVTREIDGTVSGADVADIDVNGFPEIYVWVTSAGSGSYGSLVAYAVNKGKSISEIYLPPIADDPKHSKGYMGHDEFAVVEGTFVQRFPIYREGDTNAAPTGKTRQLQYKLRAGEAGWKLELDKAVEY
jgi:hypothetical protein